MNQLNELLEGLVILNRIVYGPIFMIIILTILIIFIFAIIFSPLFIWGIHNQTTRTAKELIKLNRNFEGWVLKQSLEQRPSEKPSDERPPKEVQHEQISRSRKVFHKADYDPKDQKEKSI